MNLLEIAITGLASSTECSELFISSNGKGLIPNDRPKAAIVAGPETSFAQKLVLNRIPCGSVPTLPDFVKIKMECLVSVEQQGPHHSSSRANAAD